MNGQLYINGYDAHEMWGVVLEDGSYEKLLSGEAMKPYTTNESRSTHGKDVLVRNPRVADRSVTLTFLFLQRPVTMLTRFNAFFGELKSGLVTLHVPALNAKYRLIYEANTGVTQAGLSIAKVSVKFNEPNPNNRTL